LVLAVVPADAACQVMTTSLQSWSGWPTASIALPGTIRACP